MKTQGSLDSRAWHTATLHVVGESTLYRITASTTLNNITATAVRLSESIQDRPFGMSACSWASLEGFWKECSRIAPPKPKSFHTKPSLRDRAVRDFFGECDQIPAISVVEGWLQALQTEGLVKETAKGWSLTLAGLEAAVTVRPMCSPINITSFWINATVNDAFIKQMVSHLGRMCPRSAVFGELEDLALGFLSNMVGRNGLQKRLSEARQPSLSNFKQWSYNFALSKFRNEGRDAQTRSFKGARTEKDLRLGLEEDISGRSVPADNQAIFLSLDDEGGTSAFVSGASSPNALLDVVGGNLEDEIVHRMTAQRGISLTEAAISREKAGAKDRFSRLFKMTQEDKSYHEIGQAEGVSRNRAASLVADLRSAVTNWTLDSQSTVLVVRYIQEEPSSTLADIVTGLAEKANDILLEAVEAASVDCLDALLLGLDEKVEHAKGEALRQKAATFSDASNFVDDTLLGELVAAGRIERSTNTVWVTVDGERRSSHQDTYVLTKIGETVLDSGDTFAILAQK